MSISKLIHEINLGSFQAIAKGITLVENQLPGHQELLRTISQNRRTKIIGFTGPPGAGKSSLINALLAQLAHSNKIAVLSIDPSSPFNLGALLGDRIRMNDFYLNPHVFIRSMASRGSLGGLCPSVIEVTELLKAAPFDYIFLETVGVGQSEIEISGLADTTVVVMVPESGDEIQTMKAGVMEIADIFVVNKADRSMADKFIKNLKILVHGNHQEWEIPVLKSVATSGEGILEIIRYMDLHANFTSNNTLKRSQLLCDKVFQLIQKKRMEKVNKEDLQRQLQHEMDSSNFNLFRFAEARY